MYVCTGACVSVVSDQNGVVRSLNSLIPTVLLVVVVVVDFLSSRYWTQGRRHEFQTTHGLFACRSNRPSLFTETTLDAATLANDLGNLSWTHDVSPHQQHKATDGQTNGDDGNGTQHV